MAFFHLLLKANKLSRIRQRYHEEKLHSIQFARGEEVRYTFRQKLRRRRILLKRKIRGYWEKISSIFENTWLHKKTVLLLTDGTLMNFVVKSFCGFLGGVLLTYIFFVFFVFQLHFSLISATIVCSFIGVILTLGLAFSPRIRCIVFLFLPQFFSRRGRQALMAYAIILALAGPVRNTFHNLAVLSESLGCCQEKLKEAVQAIIDLIKQPFYALKEILEKIIKSIKVIVKRIKRTLIAIKRIVISILRVIQSVFAWLGSIVKICNKELGSPFDRCTAAFSNAVADCKATLGSPLDAICNVTYLVSIVCGPLKPLDIICMVVSYVSDAIVGVVRTKLKQFVQEVKTMFYVKIKFSHSFQMNTTKSKTLGEISTQISGEIKSKANRILSVFDLFSLLATLFFMIFILRVIYYRYKWLTSDRFDNRYISRHMREIDMKRTKQDKETIFPLNHRERDKYIKLSSLTLIRSERIRMSKSAVYLGITSAKLAIYMSIDYCLFWILDKINHHGQIEKKIEQPSYTASVKVKGQGFLAEIYRSIIKAFSPHAQKTEIEEVPCLPVPKPPDYDRYMQIATLVLFCWIMAIFEPYGLRLRHVVLNNYYPDRAKQRAVWLYNRILRSRGSFLKYARRQLRRKFGTAFGSEHVDNVSLRERIWAVAPFLNSIMPLKLKNPCLVCGSPEDKSAPHIRCPTPGCVGIYCAQCFIDLRKMCTICKSPLDYGDLTDISEERDSSDEEVDVSNLKTLPRKETDDIEDIYISERGTSLNGEKSGRKTSDDDSSKYSYSYQQEDSRGTVIPRKIPFKDIEAQEIRDDVTTQIFNEPLSEDLSSGSEPQTTCWGLTKRKKCSKAQTKKIDNTENDDKSYTSIAVTESWPTEEMEENKYSIVDLEDIDDQIHSSTELLTKPCKKKKRKKGRLKRLFKAVANIFKKKKDKQTKNYKDSILLDGDCKNSTSSTSAENIELLTASIVKETSSSKNSILRKRNNYSYIDDTHLKCHCKSSRKSSRSSKKSFNKHSFAHSMKFKTKEIPRHLKSVCNSTKYFEIDESNCSYTSPRENIEFRTDFSSISNSQSSLDSESFRERDSSTNNENDSCIYTSENNEKRYDTCTPTSDSSIIMEALSDFSEILSDSSDYKPVIKKYEKRIDNDEQFSEEDKINDDSDEKGRNRKEKKKSEKNKLYSLRYSDFKNKRKEDKSDNRDTTNIKKSKESKKFHKTKLTTTEKSDIPKADKVEKETVNAKRKNLLTQTSPIKKDRQSIGVQEKEIDNTLTKCCHRKLVYGFQPIVCPKHQSASGKSKVEETTSNESSNRSRKTKYSSTE